MTTPDEVAKAVIELENYSGFGTPMTFNSVDVLLNFIKAALSQPQPEEVTVEDYLHSFIAEFNKVGIEENCAVYLYLMNVNSRHTRFIKKNYPNGLRIAEKKNV